MGGDELVRVLDHVNEDLDFCLNLIEIGRIGAQEKLNLLLQSFGFYLVKFSNLLPLLAVGFGEVQTEHVPVVTQQVPDDLRGGVGCITD